MSVVQLDFFAANDVNGDVLWSVTDDDLTVDGKAVLEQLVISPRLRALGGGSIVLSRDLGATVDRTVIGSETFVRFLIPEVHATKYLWGMFINQRDQTLVSQDERAGEGFVLSGLGPKFYLDRAISWAQKYGASGTGFRVDHDNRVWTFADNATVGDALIQLLEEDIAQGAATSRPVFLPDLTWNFTDTDDSNGSPWTSNYQLGEDFEVEIGKSYLDHLFVIQDACDDSNPVEFFMDLGEVGSPLLELNARKNYGRDSTGTAFGSGVVLLREGVNLESDLSRKGFGWGDRRQASGNATRRATHALSLGQTGFYGSGVLTSFDEGEYAKAVSVRAGNYAKEEVLDRRALRFIRHQENADNEFSLEIVPGFDELSGYYMAGPNTTNGHVWPGDMVTLKTGETVSSALEYEFVDQHVTGVDLALREAAKDDTDLNAARSWDITLLLNVERGSSNQRNRQGGSNGGGGGNEPSLKLCRAATEGTNETVILYPQAGNHSFNPSEDAGWDGTTGFTTAKQIGTAPDPAVNGTFSSTGGGGSSNWDQMLRQGVYELDAAGAAMIAAGGAIVRGQCIARARSGIGVSEASQDLISQISIRVLDSGGSVKGTALAMHNLLTSAGSTKWRAHLDGRNASFPPAAANNVMTAVPSAAAGDFLVAEWGYRNFTVPSVSGGSMILVGSAASDLPHDDTTLDHLNAYLLILQEGVGATEGDLPEDTVRQGQETAGESVRASRCDHQHAHGLLNAAEDNYHDISHLSNYVVHGSAAPTTGDDSGDGYAVGTIWIDDSTGDVYILTDSTAGAAVWEQLSNVSVTVPEELDDLDDVTITAPAEDDDLRFDGAVWINDPRKWEAVTDGEDVFVWEGDDLVHEWNGAP